MANGNPYVTKPPQDFAMEFRTMEDDAWYEVKLIQHGFALTVKYIHFSDECDEIYHAGRFKNIKEMEDFKSRFRYSSVQLQDHECNKVVVGTRVCASHCFENGELKFYDAIVDEVKNMKHSFVDGQEQCFCTYVLFWQHGSLRGKKTYAKIASICVIRPSSRINQALASFLKIAGERLGVVLHNYDSRFEGDDQVCEEEVGYLKSRTSSLTPNSRTNLDAFFLKLKKRRRFRCAVRTFEGRINGRCKKIEKGSGLDAETVT